MVKYTTTILARKQASICFDWDAADDYVRLALNPQIEHFIWLDNAHCTTRGNVKDRSKVEAKLSIPQDLRSHL